ncbi:hypothetical protein I0P11_18735 [Acinetobacter baumannii]|uniref:hypothetical protein n=1 Tax=Acinetobacter baumannii TaxID=470 RepID=UPI0018AFD478|nr:hypothetical protein [Acinetobacter baumannii]MBF9263102.1 hypothetical protein [Acinetobacter baumannii]
MNKVLNLALVSGALFLSGCATQQVAQIAPLETSRTLPYSKDKVWASTVKIVSQKLPIQVIEKDSGLISTQTAQLPMGFNNSGYQNYFYQPNIFLATWGGANVRLNVIVNPESASSTNIKLDATYQALETNVTKSWMAVRSNGQAENKIIDEIEQDLMKSNK